MLEFQEEIIKVKLVRLNEYLRNPKKLLMIYVTSINK